MEVFQEIRHGPRVFQVGKLVADAPHYRLFVCMDEEVGRECLLQIAKEVAHNGELDRGGYILQELERRSIVLEEEYTKIKTEPQMMLNYQLGFPELVDGFICEEQGNRRINILGFRNVEQVSQIIPLTFLTKKYRVRVDLRTSAWILGKLLKDLVLAHDTGVHVGLINGNNVMIESKEHYVLVFDYSTSRLYKGRVPAAERRQDIAKAAKTALTVLGIDPRFLNSAKPENWVSLNEDELDTDQFIQYVSYILKLALGGESIAERAHKKFYENVNSFWERKYHPFTTIPL